MDIVTHTLSGIAVGTVIVCFSKSSFKSKLGIIFIGGFGAALPDFDVIILWSGFDGNIGQKFNLQSGKEIYFSKFWYSHHGFLHSAFAAFLIGFLIITSGYLIRSRFKNLSKLGLLNYLKSRYLILLSFISGFIIHLLEDMPTPHCTWGGVNFLWPSKIYTGGTGEIWWWNNYDIFLIVITIIALNTIFMLLLNNHSRKIVTSIFIIGFILIMYQIKSRPVDFNYVGHTVEYYNLERKSKTVQKDILGNYLYEIMVKLDNKIPLNF